MTSPEPGARNYQAEADAALAALCDGLETTDAAQALAVLIGRSATRLHNLARGEATAHKGEPVWPAWAALQNGARALVLQSSTCRDLAARLASRPPDAAD